MHPKIAPTTRAPATEPPKMFVVIQVDGDRITALLLLAVILIDDTLAET